MTGPPTTIRRSSSIPRLQSILRGRGAALGLKGDYDRAPRRSGSIRRTVATISSAQLLLQQARLRSGPSPITIRRSASIKLGRSLPRDRGGASRCSGSRSSHRGFDQAIRLDPRARPTPFAASTMGPGANYQSGLRRFRIRRCGSTRKILPRSTIAASFSQRDGPTQPGHWPISTKPSGSRRRWPRRTRTVASAIRPKGQVDLALADFQKGAEHRSQPAGRQTAWPASRAEARRPPPRRVRYQRSPPHRRTGRAKPVQTAF